MPKLQVKGLQANEVGRWFVRLNVTHRASVDRYGIGRLINNANGNALEVLILGHDSDDAIFMPYDIRECLGVPKGGELDFSIQKVGLCGMLRWYIGSPDPAVSIPAWIAVAGLALTIFGFVLAALPLMCT